VTQRSEWIHFGAWRGGHAVAEPSSSEIGQQDVLVETSSGFLDQFDNWANLMQGGLGSLVGAAVGGLFAVWIAKTTTRGELRVQRQISQEERERDHCKALAPILSELRASAGISKLLATSSSQRIPVNSAEFADPLSRLRDELNRRGPEIPQPLDERLQSLLVLGWVTERHVIASVPYNLATSRTRGLLTSLATSSEAMQNQVNAYLREPVPQLEAWRKEDNRGMRHLRWALFRWRARHWRGGGVRPELGYVFSSTGIHRVVRREDGQDENAKQVAEAEVSTE
jgi:hypothetical protein